MSAIAGRVMMLPKGAYNALTTYNPLDFVTYGADSYVCIQTSTGNAPTNTTYWQLLAKGSTDADQIAFDNTGTGLSATDVQALGVELDADKQPKTLSSAITIEGTSQTTVEGALSGLNGYADNIADVISENGAVNKLPNTAVSKTENGVIFTVNSDGTVSLSGTASAATYLRIHDFDMKAGTYKISGCPSGGVEDETWALWIHGVENVPSYLELGNGATFTLSADTHMYIDAYIYSGAVTTGKVFKPMITLASDPCSDYAHYVPYAMTNRELTEKVIPLDSFISISSSSTNLSSQSDVLTWFANNITTLPKNKLIPIHINYSGWDSCDGYCIIQSISNKTYKVEVSNGGGRHMDIEVVNGTMTVNKYIDFSNSW